jgi:RsiW-degrading membrane proteinase PrsW (M82 family)
MRTLAYITLTFAPVIAMSIWFYFSNRSDPPFRVLLIKAFLAGALSMVLLLLAEYISTLLGLNELRSLKRTLFYSFITIAGSAELGKFIVFRYLVLPKKELDRPIHGITFSIMVAMGFATVALLIFMLNPFGTRDMYPTTLYAFIFVPANILFSVIMGFFLGMAKFLKVHVVYSLTGLLGAAFFHGVFNFCLFTHDFKLLSLFAFGSTVIVFILGLKAAYTKPEPS